MSVLALAEVEETAAHQQVQVLEAWQIIAPVVGQVPKPEQAAMVELPQSWQASKNRLNLNKQHSRCR